MALRDKFDVKLSFPDRQYPGLQGKIDRVCERFGIEAEGTDNRSVTFKGISERQRESFAAAMQLHFTSPSFVYQVVDPKAPPPLL